MLYEFGPFRLHPAARRLSLNGEPVALTAKAFDVLVALVERAGQIVEKDALLARLWPDAVVEEGNLAQQVHTVRRALGDDGQRYIATVARRGYQFVGAVTTVPEAAEAASALPEAPWTALLAVLPLRPLGADSDDEHLGLGLADALITRLSNVRQVLVRPTSAVRHYAGSEDPQAVGRALGVGWVLQGSFRRDRERLRVTVQLVSVERGTPVWGETFNDRLSDPFSAQDAIAHRVTEALVPSLSAEEASRLSRPPTRDPEAFEAYLKGRFLCAKRTPEDLRRAAASFEAAIGRDPSYALAHAALAECLTLQGSAAFVTATEAEALARARAAARQALAIEPQLAEAHAALGLVLFRADWDWEGAERSFREAITRQPGCVPAHHFYGMLLAARGRFEEALPLIRRAADLDPLSPTVATAVGRVLHFARRYPEAAHQCRSVTETEPGFPGAHLDLGMALFALGAMDEAIAELAKAYDLSGGRPIIASVLGHVLARAGRIEEAQRQLDLVTAAAAGTYLPTYALVGLGRHDEALDLLEPARTAKEGLLVYLGVEPLFDALRDHPRFQRLLAPYFHSPWRTKPAQ
jgi:DNA-binding winged helix-turn-helix (wHTH) protein/Flp pilus assembly protein TadD